MTRRVSHSNSHHARSAARSVSLSQGAIVSMCFMMRRTPWLRALTARSDLA